MIEISDIEHNDEIKIEKGFRDDSSEGLNIKNNELKEKLMLIGLILNSIGGILYLLSVFMVFQTSLGSMYPFASGPFLLTGVISIIGTIIGVKNLKAGYLIILFSIPFTFSIGVIFFRYLDCFMCFIGFVLVPIPLPHSVFVINGGILCLISYKKKIY